MEPIIEFKSGTEMQECLKEWQHLLYLNDWIIKAKIVDGTEIPNSCGHIEMQRVHQSAVISIARLNEDISSRVAKVSQEQSLIHELLHCKYNWIDAGTSVEGIYMDETEHALLEQMARTLFMAKYGLTPEWFRNIQ